MASYPPPSGFPTHPPEILPPAGEEGARQQEELRAVRERLPGQRPRSGPRSWAYAPATYILVGINCLVYEVDTGVERPIGKGKDDFEFLVDFDLIGVELADTAEHPEVIERGDLHQ